MYTSPPPTIDLRTGAELPHRLPAHHHGLFIVKSTGRSAWWTGRIAIGLRLALPVGELVSATQAAATRNT